MASGNDVHRVIKQGVRDVPQIRFARAVAGVAIAASVASAAFRGFTPRSLLIAAAGIVGMLILMTMVRVFVRVERGGTWLLLPAQVFVWVCLVLTTVSGAVIVAGAGILAGRELGLISDSLGDDPPPGTAPEPDIVSNKSITVDDPVLTQARRPLPSAVDGDAIARELRSRRSLRLDGATLTIASGDASESPISLAFHTLELRNGSRIITGGRATTLTVATLIVDSGVVAAWATEMDRRPSPAPPGQPGLPGRNAGRVTLRVLDEFRGELGVDLRGQDGGEGGPGTPGRRGQAGNRGADAVQGVFDCRSGGQDGGGGGQGEIGGSGAAGGNGGEGGVLNIAGVLTSDEAQSRLQKELGGGRAGRGGKGGPGGPGGPGGQGGSGSGLCGGGRTGPDGPPGSPGSDGPQGEPGTDGRLVVQGA